MKKRKHNFLQKMLSVLLSAVLTAGMPMTATPAEATMATSSQTHSHEICVGSACSSSDHAPIQWTAWTDPTSLPADAGNYYLDTDVNLTDIWNPADGTSLCLNGHTVTQTKDSSSVIRIEEGITFTLCDCADVFGKLTGGRVSGVYNNNGSFYMYGGEINGNTLGSGGGVNNTGSFYLYGGKISNNTAASYRGGGVYNAQRGTFIMYGGEINGNIQRGGVGGGGGVSTEGTFAMYGGVISGNSAYDRRTSGVLVAGGTVKIGGTAVIKDNNGDNPGNLYLSYQASPLIIDVDNPLTEGAYIGIGTYNEEEPFTGENDADYRAYFHSDDAPYYIIVKGEKNELKLEHKHFLEKYDGLPADCSNPGMITCWGCGGCGKIFADAEGKTEITDENEIMIPPREHAYVWKYTEDEHWQECKYDDCGERQGDSSPHAYDGNNDMTCNDCGYDRSALDKSAPTGTITIGTDTWNSLLSTVNFNLFFKEAVQVAVTAQDTAGTLNSGVDKVYYHLSDKVLTEAEVSALAAADWTETAALSFLADSEGKRVIYIKITDKGGNVAYLSSDGLVFDKSAPVISGVADGETYYAPQEVTVTDENLESVKVNNEAVTLSNNKFTLEITDTAQTITVADKAGNVTEITVTVTEKPAHVHAFGIDWKSDKTNHWHECECGEMKDTAAHTKDNGTVTKAPTETETGTKTFKCSICGYIMETETIPASGSQGDNDKGTISTDVEKGTDTPDTIISTPAGELADIILTESEKQQAEKGADIKIVLDVKNASDSISIQNKAAIESALNGFTTGLHLDISLYKIIGQMRNAVSETSKKIAITITIPDSLKNTDGSAARTFAVIRVHNNQAEILNDLDDNPDTITIETDRFSAYSIIYKDTAEGSSTNDNNNNGDANTNDNNNNGDANTNDNNNNSDTNTNDNNNSGNSSNNNTSKKDTANTAKQTTAPKTGDSHSLELFATLAMIADLTCLLLSFANRKKGITRETKDLW